MKSEVRSREVRIPSRASIVICKTWTGTLANSVLSGSALFAEIQEVKDYMKVLNPRSGPFSQTTLRGNRATSAVSTLIYFNYL